MDNQAENPYVGTRTFTEEDAPRFFGREREARDLLALVAFEQVVLFYAQSGTGKSSLVNTQLIPGLEKEGRFEVLTPSRVTGEVSQAAEIENVFAHSLMQNLTSHTVGTENLAGLRLKDLLPKLARDTGNTKRSFIVGSGDEALKPKRRVLIIDQFEELFTTHPEEWESRADFFEQLAEALEADPNLWVLLVMREDYIAYLDPYAHTMPGGLRVRYYMEKMDYEDALKAVNMPAEKAGRPYKEGVAKQLVDDLRGRQLRRRGGKKQTVLGQYVEPIVLQAVCSTLWESLDSDDKEITTTDLKKLGNVNKALGKYYEKRVHEVAILDEVKKLGVRESEIRNWIGTKLITPDGRRSIVVRKTSGKSEGLDDSVIQFLSKKKDLIREEGHGAASIYELTHDRLTEPILENNKEWEKEHGFPFHQQVILWSESHGRGKEFHLLSEEALAEAEKWVSQNPDQLSNLESEFLDACRQKKQDEERQRARERQRLEDAQKHAAAQTRAAQQARRLTRTMFSFLALAVIALLVAGWQWMEATDRNVKLEESRKELEEQRNNQKALVDDFTATKLSDRVFEENVEFDQALLLSVQAYQLSNYNAQAQAALVQNFQKLQRLKLIFSPPEGSIPPENSNGNLRISPDGRFVALWGANELTIWNQESEISETFPVSGVKDLYFTPDNQLLVVLDRAGLRRWSLSESAIRQLPGEALNFHPGLTTRLFAGEGRSFYVSQGEDGSVFRWEVGTNEYKEIAIRNKENVTISPAGDSLAWLDENGNITLQNIKDAGKVLAEFQGANPTFSPDGLWIAVVNIDQSLTVREVADDAVPFYLRPALNGDIRSMVFSATGTYLAVSDSAETEIWDIGKRLRIGENLDAIGPAFSPDEEFLVTSKYDSDGTFIENRIHCLPALQEIETPLDGQVTGFSHDGMTIAAESPEGFIFRTISENCEMSSVSLPAIEVQNILFSPGAGVFASLESDGSLMVRDVDDGAPLMADPIYQPKSTESSELGNTDNFGDLRFSPGGQMLAYQIDDEFYLWDGRNNWAEFRVDEEEFMSDPILSWTLTDDLLLLARKSGRITKWDLSSQSRSNPDGGAHGKIDRVVFNEERSNQALSIAENSIVLVDLVSGEPGSETIPGSYLDINWNGLQVATLLNEDQIAIWDLNTGKLENDNEPLEGIAAYFSPDGAHLLATDGHTFSLYHAGTLEQVGETLAGDTDNPAAGPDISSLLLNPNGYQFRWSNNGEFFALASPGSLVQIFQLNTGNENPGIKSLGRSSYAFGGFMAFSENSNYFYFNEGNGCWIDVLNLRGDPAGWSTDRCVTGNIPIYLDGSKFILGLANPSEGDPGLLPATVFTYDLKTYLPRSIPEQLTSSNIGLDGRVTMRAYAINKGGGQLVTLGEDGALYLWDLEKEPEVVGGVFGDGENPVHSAAISPSGAKRAMFTETGITILDPADNSLPDVGFNEHALAIENVVFNHDGSLLAAEGDRAKTVFYPASGESEGYLVDGAFEWVDEKGYFWKTKILNKTSSLWNSATGNKIADLSADDEVYSSPDGNYLAIKSGQNNLTILDANRGADENKIGSQALEGSAVNFNSFGGSVYLAVAPASEKDTGAHQLWKISSDDGSLEPVDIPGSFLSFAPSGRYVAMQEEDGRIKIWDLATGASIDEYSSDFAKFSPGADLVAYQDQNQILLKELAGNDVIGRANGGSAEFSPNGSILVVYNKTADQSTLLSGDTGTELDRIDGHIKIVEDGNDIVPYIYLSSIDGGYYLFSLTEGLLNEEPIVAKSVSPSSNGRYLITVHYPNDQRVVKLWDRITGEQLGKDVDLSAWERFSEDGNLLILRNRDESITLLDSAEPSSMIARIDADRVFLMENHDYAIAMNEDEAVVTIWDLNQARDLGGIIPGMDISSIHGAVIGPDERKPTLALFGSQGVVLWDIGAKKRIGELLKAEEGTVTKLSFSSNDRYLASLGGDGIMVWDISQPTAGGPVRFIPGRILDMSFDRAEEHITYLTQDYRIFEVDIRTGSGMEAPLASPILNPDPERVCRHDLSDDGSKVAFIISDRVIVWDRAGSQTGIPHAIDQRVAGGCNASAVVFSPDSSTLAILDRDQIYLRDGQTHELVGQLKLHENAVFPDRPSVPMAFIDSQTIAVETRDQSGNSTISLWDLVSKSEKLTIEGNLKDLASNGSILLYRDKEKRVILQDQAPEDLTPFNSMSEIICALVGRNLSREEWAEFMGSEPPYPDSRENATCPNWPLGPE